MGEMKYGYRQADRQGRWAVHLLGGAHLSYVNRYVIEALQERDATIASLRAELEEARGPANNTKDGKHAGPMSEVFGPVTGRRYIVDTCFYATRDCNFGEGQDHPDNSEVERVGEPRTLRVCDCYSSREAALLARTTHGEGE